MSEGALLLESLSASRGHFRYESGHHGDLWLDLDTLFVEPGQILGWAAALAGRAAACRPEIVCGPLTGGAFLAQLVALELKAGFAFAERHVMADGKQRYAVPWAFRRTLTGRRVLLVDDAINAGSALQATLADLAACGARLVGIASLLTLGTAASLLARRHGVPQVAIVTLERGMWAPEACPLCRSGTPLIDPTTARAP